MSLTGGGLNLLPVTNGDKYGFGDKVNKVVIQNVVATAALGTKIDLIAIMKVFRHAEYRPKRFPGLVFRIKRPKTATLIFKNGKMVCTGAKSSKLARRAVRNVVKELKKAGFIINKVPDVVVQNMVATAYLGSNADLEAAADILDNIMYEPEQFPGAVYRMDEPKVVILLFTTGNIVITGAKTEEQVNIAADKLRSILSENELLFL